MKNIKLATKNTDISRVLIIGAGCAGEMVVKELEKNPQLNKKAVAIIDDDITRIGDQVSGVDIVGTRNSILKIVKLYKIDEIIFSIANISKKGKKEIIDICKNTNCKIKTIPGIYEIIDGKVDIKQVRDVEIEDLLGREPIEVDFNLMGSYIQDSTILVTGAGGSIGSELCRQIANIRPKKLIMLDNYENNLYSIQQELIRKYGDSIKMIAVVASIREQKRMEKIFDKYRPEVVFHAAAHKHVPLMENSPGEAIKNNIFGTLTNNPPFPYHLSNMMNYLNLTPKYPENRFSKRLDLEPFANGMGALGLPGDASSPSRFVKTVFLKENMTSSGTEEVNVQQYFRVLNQVSMIKGSVITKENREDYNIIQGTVLYPANCRAGRSK